VEAAAWGVRGQWLRHGFEGVVPPHPLLISVVSQCRPNNASIMLAQRWGQWAKTPWPNVIFPWWPIVNG